MQSIVYTVWFRKLQQQQWLWCSSKFFVRERVGIKWNPVTSRWAFRWLHIFTIALLLVTRWQCFSTEKMEWLIKPYLGKNLTKEQKIYNYRLSHCHQVIENAFGILSARWRIFHRPTWATVEHIEQYALAALAPHNYLQ